MNTLVAGAELRARFARVMLPFAFAFSVSYLLRTINAVVAPYLVRDLQLSAAGLGLLTAGYFFGFALMQIPVGILLDRYGPRRVNSALILLAGAGALVFALGSSVPALVLGRTLIGIGMSAGLMASVKAGALWFPHERLPAVTGWIFFAGGLGALAATTPVEFALKFSDWRELFLGLSALCAIAVVYLHRGVPEHSAARASGSWLDQLRGMGQIYRSQRFWRIALVATLTQSTYLAIQGLWAGPWLRDVAGLSNAAAARHLLWMAVAMMVGSVFFGGLATRAARRGIATARVFEAGVFAFLLVQAAITFNWFEAALGAWLLFGMLGAAGSLAFSILPTQFGAQITGRVITALNVLIFVCAFLSQWIIGVIINQWPSADGHYHPAGYRVAFSVFLALEAAALLWLFAIQARDRNSGAC